MRLDAVDDVVDGAVVEEDADFELLALDDEVEDQVALSRALADAGFDGLARDVAKEAEGAF